MGKYTSRKVEAPKKPKGQIHPLMRGIGCILIAIVPLLSYGTAVLLVKYGISQGWPIPPAWLGTPRIHPLLLNLHTDQSHSQHHLCDRHRHCGLWCAVNFVWFPLQAGGTTAIRTNG